MMKIIIVRYKARLVARGNTQLRSESFDEVFQEYKLELSKVKSLKLRCYSDTDFATNRDDRVSMGGFITFIDETPISSRTFKQKSVSLSTMEAESVSLTEAAKEFIWLKNVIDNKSLNLELSENVMFCDNQAAINFSKSPVENCRTKHIDVRYHFLWNLIYDKVFQIKYIDLNPIGHVWDALRRRIAARLHHPENTQQLKQMLIGEWVLLPQEMLHQLVLSMRRRCEATIAILENCLCCLQDQFFSPARKITRIPVSFDHWNFNSGRTTFRLHYGSASVRLRYSDDLFALTPSSVFTPILRHGFEFGLTTGQRNGSIPTLIEQLNTTRNSPRNQLPTTPGYHH
ncbi:retrovirus-related Pol polyprotein from transposon TNT 1-94 [Trichonephila clavipes]|nr:retrovirus-related Pol polyprotein from transposon TNT 1-94 [Trichonephila clavipes]